MPKKNISIVTAPNMRFVNTGMTTVELAAKSFIANTVPDSNVTFYSIIPPDPPGQSRWMMMDLGYVHKSASGIDAIFNHKPMFGNVDEIFGADLILYWGDFIQARHYIETEATDRLSKCYGLNKTEAMDFAYQALLQSHAGNDVRSKSVIFGSSLLYNGVEDYLHGHYLEYITKLMVKSPLTLLRDPMSAARVNHLTKDFSRTHLGIDPAFLLNEIDIECLPVTDWSKKLNDKGTVGLFFGARTQPPKNLLDFCQNIAKNLGLELEWLPWFPYHEKLREANKPSLLSKFGFEKSGFLQQIEDLLPMRGEYKQGDLVGALKKYNFIITDTYHLCINSWNAGTPAICFGSEAGVANNVIRDFKKRILYEMFDAKDYYFDVATISTKTSQLNTERQVCKLVCDDEKTKLVCDRVYTQAESVGQQLKKGILGVLS